MQVTTLFRTCGTLNPSVVIPTQPENPMAQVQCGVLGFGPRVRPALPGFCQEGLGLRFPWSIICRQIFVSTPRFEGIRQGVCAFVCALES
jgi:hypothetical protein